MLWVLVVLLSLILGAVLCLVIQYILLRRWYLALPTLPLPVKPQYEDFTLPKVLLDSLHDAELQEKKESCTSLNLLLQFLFSELRDTGHIRKWIMKRMNVEFEELLQTTTTGKLLDKISVRDFNLGEVFPVIQHVSVQDVKLKDTHSIEEVSILAALDYPGGFQLAVDVDMVFGKSAYLSVKITKLQGMARLQFTREPYTHWTFSFVEEPVVEFEAESQFEGRPVAQLTSIITNQIRKSIRKKHTLPNYKIRYKPFFIKQEQPKPSHDIFCHGKKVSQGELTINVIKCSRLVGLPGEGEMSVYCSLALDKLPWTELISRRKKQWTSLDLTVDKSQAVSVGLTFREEFIIDRYEMMVIVEVVTNNSPASTAGVKKGDIVISVNSIKVISSKQAGKLIKQVTESFTLRVERSSSTKTATPASAPATGSKTGMPTFKEDSVSLKDLSKDPEKSPDEYVNISFNFPTNLEKVDGPDSEAILKQEGLVSGGGRGDLTNNLTQRRKASLDNKNCTSTTSFSTDDGYKSAQSKESLVMTKSDPTQSKATKTEEKEVDLRKTKKVKFGQNPIFRQEFTLKVLDRHSYLNLCVWCSVPEKLDKQNRVLKAERDMLLGHVSIPVMDVALECMSTLQGNYRQTFQLTPAEARVGASRSKFNHLASHRGFEESLCHGDITLGFLHSTQLMSKAERRKVLKLRRNSEEMLLQQQQHQQDTLGNKESKRILMEGEHDFVTMKFVSSTFCQLCHKKIWFKSGFQCQICHFISHKKCMNSCQLLTRCSKDGWKFRDSSVAVENAKKAAKLVKSPKPSQSSQPPVSSQPNTRTSFLERFRRDKGVQLTHKNDVPMPAQKKYKFLQLLDRERSNSLSNRGHSGSDSDQRSAKEEAAAARGKKIKSSTSLDDIVKRGSGELSDTDSESEMNLLRYYEQQKSTARSDEMVVTAAKEMGRELYSYLPPVERRQKLDTMINKLQKEIDQESEHRAELSQLQKKYTDIQQRANTQAKIDKSDEKIQSLAVLMLHYCAGLQHCMEEMEVERNKPNEAEPVPLGKREDEATDKPKEGGNFGVDITGRSPLQEIERASVMSGSVYVDAEDKAEQVAEQVAEQSTEDEEDEEEEDSIFSRQRYETPQVEFERQLSTAMQAVGQSDDESPDEALLGELKSDHFAADNVAERVLSMERLNLADQERCLTSDASAASGKGLSTDDLEGAESQEKEEVTMGITVSKKEVDIVEEDGTGDAKVISQQQDVVKVFDNDPDVMKVDCLEVAKEESQNIISQSFTAVLHTPEVVQPLEQSVSDEVEATSDKDDLKGQISDWVESGGIPRSSELGDSEGIARSSELWESGGILRSSEQQSGPCLQKQKSVDEDPQGEGDVSV